MSKPESKTFVELARFFIIASGLMLGVAMLWTLTRAGNISDPPAPWNVDGIFYDNIAFNINRGEGFVVDLQAQPWRDTYLQYGTETHRPDLNYKWIVPVKGSGPTALRSPAYPYVLSGIFRLSDHNYGMARIFGYVCVGLGLAILLTFCASRWGYLAAIIAAATMSVDFSVMQSAGTLATESLAVLIFAFTFISLVRAWELPSNSRWIVAGVCFALLMLTRGIWSLGWLIMVPMAVLCLLPGIRRHWETLRLTHLVLFLATAMMVALPWWIRNCHATGHFTPFGTAGSCGFVGAYCDESLANFGQWQAKVYNENQIEVQKDFDMETVHLAHLEHAIGESSIRKSKEWCKANWPQLPKLMLYRTLSHWGLFNPSVPFPFQLANIWLVAIGLTGCFFGTGKLRSLFVFVLLLDMLLVALTWEHLGRYAIPIRPLVHVGYGVAIGALMEKVLAGFRSRQS